MSGNTRGLRAVRNYNADVLAGASLYSLDKATESERRLLAPVHVIRFRSVGIVACVLAVIDSNDVSIWMLAPFDFGHDIAARDVLPVANVVMLVTTTGAVIPSFDSCHHTLLC